MEKLKDMVICYLIENDCIWLGERKKSPWKGLIDGSGGKIEKGETPEEAQRREMRQEFVVGVKLTDLQRTCLFEIHYEGEPKKFQMLHVFLAKKWIKTPKETREMKPYKISLSELESYFPKMFPGNEKFLRGIIEGKRYGGIIVKKNENGEPKHKKMIVWEVDEL